MSTATRKGSVKPKPITRKVIKRFKPYTHYFVVPDYLPGLIAKGLEIGHDGTIMAEGERDFIAEHMEMQGSFARSKVGAQ